MLVRDIVRAIEEQTTSINELSKVYDVSDRTISSKIKQSGYQWSPREANYDFVGTDEERVRLDTLEIESMFNKPVSYYETVEDMKQGNSTEAPKQAQRGSQAKAKTVTGKKPIKQSKASEKPSNSLRSKELDKIDILLNRTETSSRVYKGFYIDEDIDSVLESVAKGNRSELVNECLRVVFKDKGLL